MIWKWYQLAPNLLQLKEKPQSSYRFGGRFACFSPFSICRIRRKPVARVSTRQIKWYAASPYEFS